MTEKLINRKNYESVEEFLRYLREIKLLDAHTVYEYWSSLTHLLFWARERDLRQAPAIRPGFVEYLTQYRRPSGKPLAPRTFRRITSMAQIFFVYMRDRHRNAFSHVGPDWIEALRPPRLRSEQAEVQVHEFYTYADALKLATFEAHDLRTRRAQAAAAFLFLSGMRIGAFLTMPISCVHLDTLRVDQFPALGMRTKNKKAATTTLFDLPDLLAVVRAWDDLVRANLEPNRMWFAKIDKSSPGRLASHPEKAGRGAGGFQRELVRLCDMVGVRYLSPHKFRHGFAMYGLDRAVTREEIKAVSQNLMHSTTGITDGTYGRMLEQDQHDTILALSRSAKGKPSGTPEIDLDALAKKIAHEMKGG